MDISQNGLAAGVAACLRGGGSAFGFDAEQWADILLMGGEPQDLYELLAAFIDPDSSESTAARERLHNEIEANAVEVMA